MSRRDTSLALNETTLLKGDLKANYQTKKAQQSLYKTARQSLLLQFHTATIQSILSLSITVWYGNTSKHTIKKVDSIITRASGIVGCKPPTLESIYRASITRKRKIIDDPFCQSHLPPDRRYRSLGGSTERGLIWVCFYPRAVRFFFLTLLVCDLMCVR